MRNLKIKQINSNFQLCPDCKGIINPILGICSCGYEVPKQYVTNFESQEEKREKYITSMKNLIGHEKFGEWKKIYDNCPNLNPIQKLTQFKQFFEQWHHG